MAMLTNTDRYHVEYDDGFLWITRKQDLMTRAIKMKGIAGHFRACLKTHSPDRTTETFIRIDRHGKWERIYKRGPWEIDT